MAESEGDRGGGEEGIWFTNIIRQHVIPVMLC